MSFYEVGIVTSKDHSNELTLMPKREMRSGKEKKRNTKVRKEW